MHFKPSGYISVHFRAGVLGFSGCMVVVANFGDRDKGWAFYLCLAASCYVILEVPYYVLYLIKLRLKQTSQIAALLKITMKISTD